MNISVNNKTLSDVLVLPIDGLSANAQEIIREVSEVYQCSRDIVLAAMFSAVGVAVGKKIRIPIASILTIRVFGRVQSPRPVLTSPPLYASFCNL